MATSQNGFSANDRSVIASFNVPGGKVALRKGDVATVLVWVAEQFHARVEPLVWPGVWGYAERTIRGSDTVLSNHASGTAIDLNAPAHPLGKTGTFSGAQVAAIRQILNFCEGAVRWGGDYVGRKDEMHFEINASPGVVARVADKIRRLTAPNPEDDLTPEQDAMLRVIFAQITGDEDGAGKDAWGWGSFRHDGGPDLTLVDFARHIDREVNSRLDLEHRPGPDKDTMFGHVLSIRAELRQFRADVTSRLAQVEQYLRTAGVDPEIISGALRAAFGDGLQLTGVIAPKQPE